MHSGEGALKCDSLQIADYLFTVTCTSYDYLEYLNLVSEFDLFNRSIESSEVE